MASVSVCPVCHNTDFKNVLECKDYTVSHETFQLQQCTRCEFLVTSPRPDDENLPRYYQSVDYVSHTERSQNLTERIYRVARSFTTQWKYRIIQTHSLSKPTSILDYGCGTGTFLSECKKRQMKIAGVEPSDLARNQATKNTGEHILSNLKQVSHSVDVITLWHVLEHVGDLDETLDGLKTRLKQNGTMFIAVPNHRSADAKKYDRYWAAYDVPRHLWHFSRNTMKDLLSNHQLNLVNVLPMRLDAYYVCLLSEKYKTGTTGIATMAKASLQAWSSNRSANRSGEYSSLIYIVRK